LGSWSVLLANGSLAFAFTPQQQMIIYVNSLILPSSAVLAQNGFGDCMNSDAWSAEVFLRSRIFDLSLAT
jgi:hypothetical protein